MRRFFLTLFTGLLAVVAQAVPAIPTPLTYQQSDGSSITVRLVGDERFSTYLTTDGLTLERAVNGDFYYKTATAVSKVRAHNVEARTQAELTYIKANSQAMQLLNLLPANMGGRNTARKAPVLDAIADVPQTGSPRIPVVLVQFSDFTMKSSNPVSTFESQFNTKSKSCLQYFTDQSRGQFTPQFDILGPVPLSQTRAYYGAKTSSDNDARPGSMVGEAVKKLTNVDWSLYDNDKNGSVDVVIILYAGPGEAQGATSNAIWPHQWYLSSAYYYGRSDYNAFYQNGVKIDKYACFCETRGSSDNSTTVDGIGTFCHEFSHCLGLPDFYDTNYGGHYGMGNWSIMCNGSYLGSKNDSSTPAAYTAYEKEFMGWMNIPTAKANTQYTLKDIATLEGSAVRIYNPYSTSEYYILENHQKSGWNAYQAASGLLVNHVTYSSSAWSNNTVNNYDPERMTVIPADNVFDYSSEQGDLYPYNGNNNLTDISTPAASLNTGSSKFMGKPITEITKNSDGTVSFWFMKNYVKEIPTLQTVAQEDITINSFTVKWNKVANLRYYILNITGPEGFEKTVTDYTETSYTITGLTAGTTYTCKVKAVYSDDTEGGWSEPVQVTTKSNPVMNVAADDEVWSNSFTASWQQMDNVESYTLHVRRKGLTNYTQLLHETFASCVKDATTNIASTLSKHVDNAGWTGKYIYQAVGGVSLANSSQSGYITSPALDFSEYNGKVVVKVTAGAFGTNTDCNLIITADGASQTITLPDNTQTEYTVVLNTNGSSSGNVIFLALPNKKITITNVDIYAGDADDIMAAGAPRKAPVVTGDADEQHITGITANSYNVTGLLDGTGYQYRVKAMFTNGSESRWSNVMSVDLKSAPALTGDVNGDGMVDIRDVNCVISIILQNTVASDYKGVPDVNGDGSIDIRDINSILYIILSV